MLAVVRLELPLIALLPVACPGADTATAAPVEPTMDIDPDVPLIESISAPANGEPGGFRLWADGRYEELDPTHSPPDAWIVKLTYSADDIHRYLEATRHLDLAQLRARYDVPARDATLRRVRFQAGGTAYKIDIRGPAQIPELEALERAMVAARRR
jgi:hypothetical protein